MNDERCRELEKKLTEKENEIRILRRKFGCVTGTDQTFIVEYDVPKRTFIYMNEATGKAINVFDDEGFLQHIIPDDQDKGEAVLRHMHSQQDELLTMEYRWVFTNTTEYSWQFNEIFPFERNAEGKVVRYLAVCHRNNIWHRMDENLKNYRRRVSFISDFDKLLFVEFIVGQNFFYVLDTKGEHADYTMNLDLWYRDVHPDDLPIAEKLLAHLQQRKSGSFHTDYRYRSIGRDQYKWYTIDAFPYKYDSDKQITNYLILGKENDAWHKTHEEIKRLSGKAELLKMMSRFLENMGRKVRTPLNAVMGFSDVMSEEESEEERRAYRKIIDENSALMIRMADDMLTLAQLESGDYVFNRENFKVSESLEEVKKSFLKKRPDANLIIHPINGDFSVTLDRARASDVINTMLNYFEIYTKGGTITIDYEIKDNGYSVSLSDPSLFIEEEIAKHLFERFENFDKSSKYIPGLGLPICKAILSNDNGRMVVDSTPEKGTTFQFWIPCETKR